MMKTNHSSKITQSILTVLLLLVALFLPFFGELLQRTVIGEEYVCCMPDNRAELEAKAEIARSLRPVSNLIIGGSIVIGIGLVIFAIYSFYRQNRDYLKNHPLAMLALSVIAIYALLVLSAMLTFFTLYNNLYFEQRPWPGGSLYDGTWYNPLYYWW